MPDTASTGAPALAYAATSYGSGTGYAIGFRYRPA